MTTVQALQDLSGRNALVVGGAGHIGWTAVETLTEMGATVRVWDLETAHRTDEAASLGVSCLALDIADDVAVKTAAADIGKLDILVHAAALAGTSDLSGWSVPFAEQSVDTWRKALDVNLTSAFKIVQSLEGQLRASGHGAVILISSIYGMVGADWGLYEGTGLGNPGAYAASKGGMLQLTRWLSTALAPDVRVNAISPGGIFRDQPENFVKAYSDRTPLGRMGTETDLKGAIAYLGSDLSAYVTGHNLVVDGGWTAK